jgi:hypothetical protein
MAVSSCLKILEKAGYIERGSDGEHQARVTLRMERRNFAVRLMERATLLKRLSITASDVAMDRKTGPSLWTWM